jgi:hypothetical protein
MGTAVGQYVESLAVLGGLIGMFAEVAVCRWGEDGVLIVAATLAVGGSAAVARARRMAADPRVVVPHVPAGLLVA